MPVQILLCPDSVSAHVSKLFHTLVICIYLHYSGSHARMSHTHTRAHAHTHTHTQHIRVHTHTYIHTHTHTHTQYTHTHTHKYTHTWQQFSLHFKLSTSPCRMESRIDSCCTLSLLQYMKHKVELIKHTYVNTNQCQHTNFKMSNITKCFMNWSVIIILLVVKWSSCILM